jgi:tagaturonate reductase
MNLLAETRILQFGTGKLLRGLFDPMLPQAGIVTVLQSRDEPATRQAINAANEGYHLWIRGFQAGEVVSQVQTVDTLGQAHSLVHDWTAIAARFGDPSYRLVVSNTTEKGLSLDDRDRVESVDPNLLREPAAAAPPHSFPSRLLAMLRHRYLLGIAGPAIMPLELIENNAQVLQQRVLEQAERWQLSTDTTFMDWLRHDCRWLSTLVDRICVDPIQPTPWSTDDPLAVMTEPFQMLVIEDDGGDRTILPTHPAITWAGDLRPYFLQKVRILNGLHTAMVARCLPLGFQHVIDVMNEPEQVAWLHELLNNELVPTLEAQGLEVQAFAQQVLDRFRNPFFLHRLTDIAVGHETKLQVRLAPTQAEYQRHFGKTPQLLSEILAAPLPT